jgi:peroxiredoxin
MAQLRHDYTKFIERSAEIIAIGPEDAESFTKWWHEHKMPFIGVPDPEHKVAGLYGQQVKLLKFGRMPAMFVIDRHGRVRYLKYGESMSDIVSSEEILVLLDRLNEEEIGGGAG